MASNRPSFENPNGSSLQDEDRKENKEENQKECNNQDPVQDQPTKLSILKSKPKEASNSKVKREELLNFILTNQYFESGFEGILERIKYTMRWRNEVFYKNLTLFRKKPIGEFFKLN